MIDLTPPPWFKGFKSSQHDVVVAYKQQQQQQQVVTSNNNNNNKRFQAIHGRGLEYTAV